MLIYNYKKRLKDLRGISTGDIPKMHHDINIVKDTNSLLSELFNVIMAKDQKYGSRWLIGLERYVQDQKKSIERRFTRNLSRGHIIEVELFGHFNKELTFLHPAVVLYDNNRGQLLVAPISSTKYNDNDPLHIDVDSSDGLHHGSGICLEAIRGVDKNRVLYQYDYKGRKAKVRTEVLDKIDLTIMEYFLPTTFKQFKKLEDELDKERKKVIDLEEENEFLRKQLDKETVPFAE
ncbi:type II toxin-antitoxin system PemK/MazF family toxin [Priestia filamentosa]|uniref:type II toxin-antitoxin system PemK/MazF family toxin n=1 Tax=Priestia filamentosa TaxID=1402861 RepID=UPI000A08B703|nr:type II toxin-antitoxin system PemK/MazF family toxin [Priestia filamentosa]MDT3765836.1 type II toxin-antitoxin system PemK/MazF family toxin [Priestia filamentosa]SMF70024.1 PemK-like, MazF-like toxin of type II toxin-antitoxin system [Priestia filamentosa]